MFDFLDKLRAKPEHIRRRVLYGTTAFAMLVVFGIWASTLGARFAPSTKATVAYEKTSPVSALSQTASVLFGGIKSAITNVKKGLPDANQKINGSQVIHALSTRRSSGLASTTDASSSNKSNFEQALKAEISGSSINKTIKEYQYSTTSSGTISSSANVKNNTSTSLTTSSNAGL
jgi:hypothetical protein